MSETESFADQLTGEDVPLVADRMLALERELETQDAEIAKWTTAARRWKDCALEQQAVRVSVGVKLDAMTRERDELRLHLKAVSAVVDAVAAMT